MIQVVPCLDDLGFSIKSVKSTADTGLWKQFSKDNSGVKDSPAVDSMGEHIFSNILYPVDSMGQCIISNILYPVDSVGQNIFSNILYPVDSIGQCIISKILYPVDSMDQCIISLQ